MTQEPKAVGAQSILLLRRHQLLGQALPKVPHQRLLVRSKTMVLVPPLDPPIPPPLPPRRLRPPPGLPSTVRLIAPSVSSPPLTCRLICPASLPPPLLSRPSLLHISPFRPSLPLAPSPLSPSPLATGDFVVITEMEGRWRSGRWGDRLGCSFGCWCAGIRRATPNKPATR